jgi:hypothetical protein
MVIISGSQLFDRQFFAGAVLIGENGIFKANEKLFPESGKQKTGLPGAGDVKIK